MSVGGSTDVISAIPKTGDLPRPYDPSLSAELQDLEYLGTDVVTADGEALNSEQDVYTINDQNLGLYGEAHIELDDWLSLTAGARYDSSTRYGGSINPRAVLVASSDDGLQVKALYGEAYLSPSPYKSYQHFGSFSATRDETGAVTGLVGGTWHLPNPDLAPEKIRTGELSVVWRWSERLRVDLDGFASRLDNLIEIRDQGPGTFKGVPVESVERAENVSRGEVYGVTLRAEGRLRLGALSLRPHGSYAWIDGQMGGEALSYTAEHSIKAGVDFVWRDTSVSAMLRYASKSEHARVTQEDGDRVSVDGGIASRLFVRQRFQLGESLPVSLWLRVDNVLDRRGWDLSYAGAEGLARVPHEPLRAQLGLSIGALDL
jgi:iron complex outermembrane receptor protein